MSLSDFYVLSTIGEEDLSNKPNRLITGVSSYTKVLKVKRKVDEQNYALKKINIKELDEKERTAAANEVRILASLRHPNLICFKETFLTADSSSLW